MRRMLSTGAALAALAFPAAASAMDGSMIPGGETDGVSIQFAAYAPARIDILAGDTVRWANNSVRVHTVNADDGTWLSPRIVASDSFSHRFDAPGTVTYHCVLHPFMRGEVDVHRVLLSAPTEPGAPGRPYTLHGRAAMGTNSVTIQADSGAGFRPVATAAVDPDGSFTAEVVPTATATYRAVAGTEDSPAVQLLVLDRTLTASAASRGRRVVVDSKVAPASPGAPVVLQLRLPQHFGWWPVARAKLDSASRARFALKLARRYPARVVLTLADGATVLASSRTLYVGPR